MTKYTHWQCALEEAERLFNNSEINSVYIYWDYSQYIVTTTKNNAYGVLLETLTIPTL